MVSPCPKILGCVDGATLKRLNLADEAEQRSTPGSWSHRSGYIHRIFADC
jgi:hypothetical protein